MRVPFPAAMMTTSMFAMKMIPCFSAIINQRLRPRVRSAKWWVLGCVLGLSACSLAVSAYNNAAQLLMFLWIDPHLKLNKAQKEKTLADLQAVLNWHREKQLPAYADLLLQMKSLAVTNISAQQVCAVVDQVSDLTEALAFQLEEPVARLVLTLTPAQLQTFKNALAQDAKDHRKEWRLDDALPLQSVTQ